MSTAFEIVKKARLVTRPTGLEYINTIFEDFIELHGDRFFADDKAVIGGIATLNGAPVTVIAIQKGHALEENILRNFGSPHPEGYRKALRLMKQAEKFNRPVITFINTPGAFCGIGAEERGQGEAIAKNLMEMMQLKVPTIAVLIGEGGSGGALALAVCDTVWALENAIYSILSPEGFASILWKDAAKAEEAAEFMQLTSKDLLRLEVIDKIIDEPKCEDDLLDEVSATLKQEIETKLAELRLQDLGLLLENRHNRFRKFGAFEEV